MPTKEIREALKAVGHVAEVGRLLSILGVHRDSPLTKLEILELASQTAGAGHRYPEPAAALDVSLLLGLVRRRGVRYDVTALGERFLQSRTVSLIDLSPLQQELLLGLVLDDQRLSEQVSGVLRAFRSAPDGRLQARATSLDDARWFDVMRLLQQLGVLEYEDGTFRLNVAFEVVLADTLKVSASLGEEDLWKRLAKQRERARMVEELVVQEEKHRLGRIGRADLAEGVFRISEINVAAGYDIHSFEGDGSPRCIEVKSSVGKKVRFEWSVDERTHAAR